MKLGDFGKGRFISEKSMTIQGEQNNIAPDYLSDHYTPKAEVFSLGVIAYELLTN